MSRLGIKRPWTFIILGVLLAGFIVLQIPSFDAAQYNYNGSDDIWFGRFTHSTWTETHNIFSVIGAAIYTAGHIWTQWQGNYTAVFMFAFNPSIFDDWGMSMYGGPFIIIGMLGIGVFFLCYTIFTFYLKNKWELSLSLATVLMIIFTQLVPTYRETYYWWAASVNYPFYLGVTFLLVSCVLRYFRARGAKRVFYFVATLLLAVFIAGGMYVFLTLLITGGLLAIFYKEVIYKNSKGRRIYLIYIAFLFFSALNIFAPGNQYRMASVEAGAERNPILAIIKSIWFAFSTYGTFSVTGKSVLKYPDPATGNNYTFDYVPAGPNWAFFAMLILVTIFVFVLMKNTRFKFKYPGLLYAGLFIVYASWYTPFIYGQGMIVMPRVFNGGYMVFWFFFILSMAFGFGWLRPRLIKYQKTHRRLLSQKFFGSQRALAQLVSVPLLLALFTLGFFNMNTYANGFKTVKPGALGAWQGTHDLTCQYLDRDTTYTGAETNTGFDKTCVNGTDDRRTMAEWNVVYINQFKHDLLGSDVSDELAEKCIANFWAEGCQEQMAKSQTVVLPDTPEEDKLITAHLDMCPQPHYGYNKFAEKFWDKQQVSAYYPDFQMPQENAGLFGPWGTVTYYEEKKQSDCSNPGMADLQA
ncbi:MAG: hypothetical protein LBC43_05180 [Bifidobacteriaceae bacterium]|jgi:hypothetical protein|nr:hypothetical protein [Bifidobacteriaceae bacterium]